MAWKTGKHAEAPQGVMCYGGLEAGTVTWYEPEEGDAPPPPPPAKEPDPPHRPPPSRDTKHG